MICFLCFGFVLWVGVVSLYIAFLFECVLVIWNLVVCGVDFV